MPTRDLVMAAAGQQANGFFSTPAAVGVSLGVFTDITVNSSGKFVAVGYNSANKPIASTSTDGITWTSPVVIDSVNTVLLQAVTVNTSGTFVAVGADLSNLPYSYTSTDGVTWSSRNAIWNQAVYMFDVAVNGTSVFIATGKNISTNLPVYTSSTDGVSWSTPTAFNGTTTQGSMTAISWVNGRWVAVGFTQTPNFYPWSTSSLNGTTWTTPALMGGSSTVKYMYSVTGNGSNNWVAVGYNDSNQFVYSTSSDDGVTWTAPTGSQTGVMTGIARSSAGQYVAVGSSGYSTSTNGTTWSTVTALGSGSPSLSNNPKVAVNTAGRFVVVGTLTGGFPGYSYSSI